ncbi:hypothetical protein Syn7502_01398 [Synechococcus sp. PCC 7502]|uniref:hypothetical protein n=1 Tax=Synechococcus sp. PCC 7502 TaxID=1173263 RepID=UPI00029FE551|nr:hypothetical protein [Synechococcus sp. PCC 7502]AFY73479.1 hypothetical protein Syn7502_01398 [Synechococcus sp. PCC 7502]
MQIPSLKGVTQNTKDFLDATVNSVSQDAQQARTVFLERSSQSIEVVNNLAEKAKLNLTEAAGTVTEKTSQLINGISNTTVNINKSLEATLEKINNLNQTLSEGIQASINTSLKTWVDNHPQLIWLINHPLQSLGISLLGLFFFLGLLGAISKITEKFWLFILTYPFNLMSSVYRLISNYFQKDSVVMQKSESQERIAVILSRLELIGEEQNLLSQELKTLLK